MNEMVGFFSVFNWMHELSNNSKNQEEEERNELDILLTSTYNFIVYCWLKNKELIIWINWYPTKYQYEIQLHTMLS